MGPIHVLLPKILTTSQRLLFQRLPDTTMLRLASLPTAHARWYRVSEEYTAKSVYAQNDLEQTFLEMRCPKGGDVRTFLTDRAPWYPRGSGKICCWNYDLCSLGPRYHLD